MAQGRPKLGRPPIGASPPPRSLLGPLAGGCSTPPRSLFSRLAEGSTPALLFLFLLLFLLAAQFDVTRTENTYENGYRLCQAAGGICRTKSACNQHDTILSGHLCKRHNFICCIHTAVSGFETIRSLRQKGSRKKKAVSGFETIRSLRQKGSRKKKGCKKTAACKSKGGKCKKIKKGCKNEEIIEKNICSRKKKCICCKSKRVQPPPPPQIVCEVKQDCTDHNGKCTPNSDPCSQGFEVNYVKCHSSYCKCCMAPSTTSKPVSTVKTIPRYPACPKSPAISALNCLTCGVAKGPKVGRITGGVSVTIPNKYPWLVWIEYNGMHWCVGSIINSQFVLTAAQCLYISCKVLSAQQLSIIIGDHNRNSKLDDVQETCKVMAEELIPHPDFKTCSTRPNDHDIALIKLSVPLSFVKDSVLRPICLPTTDETTYIGKSAIVSGWGLTSLNSDYPDLPHEVNITVIDNSICDKKFWYWSDKYMLCAGATNQAKDACTGDAGAPLIAEGIQERFTVIGTVSGGDSYCQGPGVYTRVGQHLDWIKKTADLSMICP